MTDYSIEELTAPQSKSKSFTPEELNKAGESTHPDEGFATHAMTVIKDSVSAMAKHPLNWDAGVAKAVGSGMYDMAALSVQGLSGLATAMTEKASTWDEKAQQFDKGMAHAKALTDNYKEVLGGIMHLNLSNPNEEEQAATKLLSLLPDGINAAGDTVYEKTGSALAGAGTQAMLTLLTLKPSVAGKMMNGVASFMNKKADIPGMAGSKASGEKVTSVFDELAAKQPDAAGTVAEHVGKADPNLEKYLKKRIQKFVDASEEELGEIGRKAAEANINEITSPGYDVLKDKALSEWKNKQPYLGVGKRATGAIQLGEPTMDQAGAGIRDTIRQAYEDLNGPADKAGPVRSHRSAVDFDEFGNAVERSKSPNMKAVPGKATGGILDPLTLTPKMEDPVIYMNGGFPVTAQMIVGMFRFFGDEVNKVPAIAIATGKLSEWGEHLIRTFNPEMLGKEAKMAATIVAKGYSKLMSRDSSNAHQASARRTFWNQMGGQQSMEFINQLETGKPFANKQLETARQGYMAWNEAIAKQDAKTGFTYEPRDNHMTHIFENQPEFEVWANRKYGKKWGDPSFIKARQFQLYADAIKADFKPKYTNPEDIMLARQHASDVAEMQADILSTMEKEGIAVKVKKGETVPPEGFAPTVRRSPTGQTYWVHSKANAIMHNAFDTQSLWNLKGPTGDVFRGAMALKNKLIPIKLAASLFHPLHIMSIDNVNGMKRATKALLGGSLSPAQFIKEMGKSIALFDTLRETGKVIKNIDWFGAEKTGGNRMLRIYNGKIPESQWTAADKTALQYMFEGGVAPGLDKGMRMGSIAKFKDAIQKGSGTALWHAPWAGLEWLQGLIFDHWIPSLKVASYLKDVGTHLQLNPHLISQPMERGMALRKIAKSVDNQYGEMQYNTLFWPKMVKDIAVANTLSLGWQMGFFREYGGGALDLGQGLLTKDGFQNKVKAGLYDRPIFTTLYTAQALAYGGLLTYALTGKSPQSLDDYIFPRTGGVDKNGKPQRVNTMFYTREFGALAKHIKTEGVANAVYDTVTGKASGLIGLAKEAIVGVNNFGVEIRDPNSPVYKQLEQTLAYALADMQPISSTSIQRNEDKSSKAKTLTIAGFSPAPKYVTQTPTEGRIGIAYNKYVGAKETPYHKAEMSKDTKLARAAYDAGDVSKYQDIVDGMEKQYNLAPKELKALETKIQKGQLGGDDATQYMFKRLQWPEQKAILDKATPEEREMLLQIANKQHRGSYIPPEQRREDNAT